MVVQCMKLISNLLVITFKYTKLLRPTEKVLQYFHVSLFADENNEMFAKQVPNVRF